MLKEIFRLLELISIEIHDTLGEKDLLLSDVSGVELYLRSTHCPLQGVHYRMDSWKYLIKDHELFRLDFSEKARRWLLVLVLDLNGLELLEVLRNGYVVLIAI